MTDGAESQTIPHVEVGIPANALQSNDLRKKKKGDYSDRYSKKPRAKRAPGGRPNVLTARAEEIATIEPGYCPEGNKAWDLFVKGAAIYEIATIMHRSPDLVRKWIALRTADLRKIHTPEEQAKGLGLVLARYNKIFAECWDRALACDPEERNCGPAYMALALKATESLAKVYGCSGEKIEETDIGVSRRLMQISERLQLVGAHAHARVVESLVDQSLRVAGADKKAPEAPVIDGNFEVVT